MFKSRKLPSGKYEYEIEPGRWVSRQRVNQLRNRKAHSVRTTCYEALKVGTLTRQPCEKCGEPNAQFHHFSYDDAFAILWLCQKHHNLIPRPRNLTGAELQPPRPHTGRKKGKWIRPLERIAALRKEFDASGQTLYLT